MILIGLGGNLASHTGAPEATIRAAYAALEAAGVVVAARSRFYRSAPVPVSDQPWYINAVARIETDRAPRDLLALLHRIETDFGRQRRGINGARTLDLDLLAYNDRVSPGGADEPVLPHPRMYQRAFVLLPLREVASQWRHPVLDKTVDQLIAELPHDQLAEPI
jgi:2-amino-4-hydroxy-6-hydroxymethyldihydropteridine diphosphokinase